MGPVFSALAPSTIGRANQLELEVSYVEVSRDGSKSDSTRRLEKRCAFKEFLLNFGGQLAVLDRSQVAFDELIAEGIQDAGVRIYGGTLQGTSQSGSFSNSVIVCIAVKKFRRLAPDILPSQISPRLWASSCVHVCSPLGVFFIDEESSACMVMPRYSSDLRRLIKSRMELPHTQPRRTPVDRPFTELVAIHIIFQLALGLKGLHDCQVYHRDIKAANILVNKYSNRNLEFYEVAVADFEGTGNHVGTGTTYWRAPEVLLSKKSRIPLDTAQWQAADMYSFGMTCYEILTGKTPFEGLENPRSKRLKKLRRGHHLESSDNGIRHRVDDMVLDGLRPKLPAHIPKKLRSIIHRCWQTNPDHRPKNFDEILACLKEVDAGRLASAGLGIPKNFMRLEAYQGLELPSRPTLSHILSQPLGLERSTHFSFWASEYYSTQEQFVSKLNWKDRLLSMADTHDSLTFAEFVERRRSLAFVRLQRDGSGHNIEATKDKYSRSGPVRVEARMCGPKVLSPSDDFRRYSSSPSSGSIR